MKDLFAYISRKSYILPGGYYLYKLVNKIFPANKQTELKIIETPLKYKIQIDISKYLGNKIYWRGAHDWNTIFALKKNISSNDTIIDIGANIGEYTLSAASLLDENGKVMAFEPVKKMYEQLIQNIELNPHLKNKILVIKKALGNQKNILPIYDEAHTDNEGLYSLHQKNFKNSIKIEDIEIDTLDQIFKEYKISTVQFIKIDVEGNELFVLEGAKEVIQNFKPKLMIEISEKNIHAAGYTINDLFEFLNPYNYSIFLIQKRGSLKKIRSSNSIPYFCNILAVPSK